MRSLPPSSKRNAATARFLGTTPPAMRRRRATELGFPPELIRKWLEQCRETRALGRPVEAEHSFTRGGLIRWMSVTVSALPDDPGTADRCCYVAADTTDTKQLEQQFLRAQNAQKLADFGTDQVLSAIAACQGKVSNII